MNWLEEAMVQTINHLHHLPTAVQEILPQDLVYLSYRGSIVHGTYRPQSQPDSIDDRDLIGVFVAPLEHYLGFGRQETMERKMGEWDCVFYEFRKMVQLLAKQNPNVLMTLWMPEEHVLLARPLWSFVLRNRRSFQSKTVYFSFAGYARSQFKRMTSQPSAGGYMGVKRKQLVERHGYDTKNAAHLIRLLEMCAEYLETGELIVERHNAEQLLAIKSGEHDLRWVEEVSLTLEDRCRRAFEASCLPEKIDMEGIERFCVRVLADWFAIDGSDLR